MCLAMKIYATGEGQQIYQVTNILAEVREIGRISHTSDLKKPQEDANSLPIFCPPKTAQDQRPNGSPCVTRCLLSIPVGLVPG